VRNDQRVKRERLRISYAENHRINNRSVSCIRRYPQGIAQTPGWSRRMRLWQGQGVRGCLGARARAMVKLDKMRGKVRELAID